MVDLEIGIRVVGAEQAADEIRKVGSAASEAGKQSAAAGTDFLKMGKSILGIGAGAALVANGLFGMQDALDSVEKADIRADKAHRTLSEAKQRLARDQAALNKEMTAGVSIERNSNGEVSLSEASQKALARTMADGTRWYTNSN